jgi:hypothetical protein
MKRVVILFQLSSVYYLVSVFCSQRSNRKATWFHWGLYLSVVTFEI